MPVYPQIWFPSGEAAGDDAKSGRSTFTRRSISVLYAPSGDSQQPAATISHLPLDDTGLDAPALKVEAGIFSQGDAVLIEKFSETGAFLTGELGGADIFSVEGDGDIWNLGTMYAHKANVGGIAVAADGTTALDMTLGNLFTSTPTQNTVWSTVAPTNGIGGQRAAFIIDNSGGYTVSWSTGFTGIDPIAVTSTGIHIRYMQFDGTTWRQMSATEDSVTINIRPEHLRGNMQVPDTVQDNDNEVLIWVATDAPITVTKISISLDASGNEVAGDLKWADAFIGLANATVINGFDTTSGVRVDTSITAGSVDTGKCLYFSFDSSPSSDIKQMGFDIEYTYD